jgi:hypothetical protein
MAESVARHNIEKLPFFISVPKRDLEVFRSHLAGVELICEEDIIAKNPGIRLDRLYSLPGGIQQQIIKSEFWRLGLSENYLVLDSDCVFIRDFGKRDFLAVDNVPYSVVHEGRSLLQATARFGPERVREEFLKDRRPIMNELGREGVVYDFGYAPFLWSRRVWQDLAEKFLAPRSMTFLDAVLLCSSEFTWYGEALLKFRSIPIWPREELFRHYHYEYQYWLDRKLGFTPEILAKDYLGIVYQSNWQVWEDFGPPRKSLPSRIVRSSKRLIKKALFKAGLLRQ